MPRPRNTRSFTELFAGIDTSLKQFFIERPKAMVATWRARARDLPKTNFDLGCDFAERGLWFDAIFRFRVALWLRPDYPQAWYNLGTCYFRMNKRREAKNAFKKALQQQPSHGDAIFMLSALDPASVPADKRPTRMPKDMVIGFFTQAAPNFDSHEQQNRYQGPRLIYENVRPLIAELSDMHVLDLGCGTGLVSRPWRGHAEALWGVDFTPAMLEIARAHKMPALPAGEKPQFDRLLLEDATALPEGTLPKASFDLVLAVNMLHFVGDPEALIKTAAAALKPGALLALTIEPLATQLGYGINPDTGRFGHQPEFIKRMASTYGLIIKKEGRIALYPEIPGFLLVFTKGAA